MIDQSVLITGSTGLMGEFLLNRMQQHQIQWQVHCFVRVTSNLDEQKYPNLQTQKFIGDCQQEISWLKALDLVNPKTIIHVVSIRHVPVILQSLSKSSQNPRLIIIGTTGVYSKYNQYSAEYKSIEQQLEEYSGSYCLLRPTMIYGSHRDKNLHKLIKFCDRWQFFPVFGSGQCLLQPVHADDLAQAILSVFLNPEIQGAYDLSGGTVVTFLELLDLVEKLLGKPIHPLHVPYTLGLWSATLAETFLGRRSPIRREQILRLQEDKAYSHEAAKRDFGYNPRSLEVGLQQEVELMHNQGVL